MVGLESKGLKWGRNFLVVSGNFFQGGDRGFSPKYKKLGVFKLDFRLLRGFEVFVSPTRLQLLRYLATFSRGRIAVFLLST